MAVLADYEAALAAFNANPTPANASAAASVHSLLPLVVKADGLETKRPDLPSNVKKWAEQHVVQPGSGNPRVILGRVGYGDGR